MDVLITVAFEGYPDGLTRTHYAAGKQETVPEDFGHMIIDKGLAVAVVPPPAEPESNKTETNKGSAK